MIAIADGIYIALITSISTLSAASLTQWWLGKNTLRTLGQQSRLERAKDAQQLRDRRHERLRNATRRLAHIVLTLELTTRELAFVWAGETPEVRDKRVAEKLTEATEGIDEARLTLMLEAGGDELLRPFDAAWNAYMEWRFSRQMNTTDPGFTPYQEMRDQIERLSKGVSQLLDASKARLEELQRPIPD